MTQTEIEVSADVADLGNGVRIFKQNNCFGLRKDNVAEPLLQPVFSDMTTYPGKPELWLYCRDVIGVYHYVDCRGLVPVGAFVQIYHTTNPEVWSVWNEAGKEGSWNSTTQKYAPK